MEELPIILIILCGIIWLTTNTVNAIEETQMSDYTIFSIVYVIFIYCNYDLLLDIITNYNLTPVILACFILYDIICLTDKLAMDDTTAIFWLISILVFLIIINYIKV